jgi:hypothetical protein
MKVEGVIGILGIVGVTPERLLPGDDLAGVFDDHLAGGNTLQGKDAQAVHTGAPSLYASSRRRDGF